jgi:hypothetical protein
MLTKIPAMLTKIPKMLTKNPGMLTKIPENAYQKSRFLKLNL